MGGSEKQKFSAPRSAKLIFIVVAFTLPMSGSFRTVSGSPGPFSIRLSATQNIFKSGSNIRLQIVLTNTSRRNILITMPLPDQADIVGGFWATVRDKKGNALRRIDRAFVISSIVAGELPPTKSLTYTMLLNNSYDLSKPDKYRVQIHRTDPTSKIEVTSNTIAVTLIR